MEEIIDDEYSEMTDADFQKMMFESVETSSQDQKDKPQVEFDNVIKDDYDPYEITDGDDLSEVFKILQKNMEDFYDYIFIVHASLTSEVPNTVDASWFGKKRVLIWTAGEHKYQPEDAIKDNYHHIFAQYHWDTENITSIPLGCYAKPKTSEVKQETLPGQSFVNISTTKPSIDKKIIPMNERAYNMSFIGALNRNRMELASILSKTSKTLLVLISWKKFNFIVDYVSHMARWLHPRDYFKFTPDFAKGFDKDTYLDLLHSSKISLCPRGWSNVESFRIYESMRAGCVTITERLPDRSYYKNIPVIQVDNWHDGLNIARDLVKDKSGLLTRLGEASRLFYETKLSPEATAKIIMDKLAEKAI